MALLGSYAGTYIVNKLVSSSGRPYLGFLIDEDISSWEQLVPSECVAKKRLRDKHHHVTLISSYDYQSDHNVLIGINAELNFLGLGTATDGESVCYFVAIDSKEAQAMLEAVGLKHKDLHLTLGFSPHDVHGVPKRNDWRLFNVRIQ